MRPGLTKTSLILQRYHSTLLWSVTCNLDDNSLLWTIIFFVWVCLAADCTESPSKSVINEQKYINEVLLFILNPDVKQPSLQNVQDQYLDGNESPKIL